MVRVTDLETPAMQWIRTIELEFLAFSVNKGISHNMKEWDISHASVAT